MQRITLSSFHQLPSHDFPEVVTLLLCCYPAVPVYFACPEMSGAFVALKSIRANSKRLCGTSWELKDNRAFPCSVCPFAFQLFALPSFMQLLYPFYVTHFLKSLTDWTPLAAFVSQFHWLVSCWTQRSFSSVPLMNNLLYIQALMSCFRTGPLSQKTP